MRNVLNKHLFKFMWKGFSASNKKLPRQQEKGRGGTWISDEIENAYISLFEKGFAHSAEAWQNNELVGGLYGVLIGKVFFGESMFAKKSNASKFAFIK